MNSNQEKDFSTSESTTENLDNTNIDEINGINDNNDNNDNNGANDANNTEDTENTDTVEEEQAKEPAVKRKVPLFSKIFLGIAAFCGILYILFLNIPSFSDFFNKNISPIVRGALSYLTTWIPFSLAEMLLILIPVIIVVIVGIGIKKYSDSWRNVGVFCVIMLSIASYVFSTYTLGFVPAYHGSTLDKKMELDKQKVSADELYETSMILSAELAKESEHIIFNGEGASVMPYGYGELNDKLMEAYEKACEKYDFISPLHSNIKEVMLSEPMTYTHISGVYTFFTGEANLNVNFPDYVLPYTAAHEFAHQRGIAREDEANFVAFIVCMESDDHYIRYSAYLNVYEYVANALYSADNTQGKSVYSIVYKTLPYGVKTDMAAYSKFFKKYQKTVVSDVSGAVNDTFLNINGVEEGSKSYGMVVDLAVAYYKNESNRATDTP